MLHEKDVLDTIGTAKQFFHHLVEKINIVVADVESRASVTATNRIEFNDIRYKYMSEAVRCDAEYITRLTTLENDFAIDLYELLQSYDCKVSELRNTFVDNAAAVAVACHKELSAIISPEIKQEACEITINPGED